LFINNIHPYKFTDTEECLYVSWYLACDMQFFIISPIFVLAYLRDNSFGILLTLGTSLISSFAAFYGTFEHNWSAHSFDGLWVTNYTIDVYTKPQYRISSYAIGILTAMLWRTKQKLYPDFKLSAETARILMSFTVASILYLIFGAYTAYQLPPCDYYQSSTEENPCGSNWSITARAFYIGFTRLFWSIFIGIIVLLSGNNQGEVVQGFLSHPIWAPSAKLTFAVYLLHITILNVWFYNKGEKIHFNLVDFYMSFFGVLFVSFFCALILTVLVESPSATFAKSIEKYLSKSFALKSRKTEVSLQNIQLSESQILIDNPNRKEYSSL